MNETSHQNGPDDADSITEQLGSISDQSEDTDVTMKDMLSTLIRFL